MDSHHWDTSLDQAVVPLFLHLQWAQNRSLEVMRPLLAKHQLSAAEFDVLATLRNAPPAHEMTPSEIQHEVVITSGGLTKVMLQLEARGLVERLQSQKDLRVKPARLTASGKRRIEAAMQAMVNATGAWFRTALSGQEMARLTTLLQALVNAPPAAGHTPDDDEGD